MAKRGTEARAREIHKKAIIIADRLPEVAEAMVRRGFSETETRKVLGGNYLRVLEAVIG